MECKCRKSRDTWSNRQIWRWIANGIQSKANRVMPRQHTAYSTHPGPAYSTQPSPATQEKTLHMVNHLMFRTDITLILLFAVKDGEAI